MKWNPELYKTKHAFVFDYGESLIELLKPQEQERILDLGCGTGELTHKISQTCPHVVGIDKSPEMIEKAQHEFPGIHFEVGDAANFNFKEKFDAIFSNATLHWVNQYQAAAQCMYDNLVEGGRIVVEFGGKGNVQSIVNLLKSKLADSGYTEQAQLNPWYFPSIGAYSSELERVGFRVSYAVHYDRPTQLADNDNGIIDWIKMFGRVFFKGVDQHDIEAISATVQDELETELFQNGHWYADYKRIRIVAYKEGL
ncbi:MAG: methyltransferase domain-containing protein [Bacteroidota bacterium]